ncbi:acyl-CoA synthetase [Flavisphingomonas formosensis]|uniref:acyl-CoA synthetase n=1 Tax=Flavisphingomonas formosensis TaxID=861534 RepID=UPI0018DF9AA1|nr:long-chain fatty acid--CoA ligase [Sphingomonas formosensis]
MKTGLIQGLRRAVQIRPAGIALIDGERRFTWTELSGRIARLAGAFRTLGLAPGDRVALLALNSHRSLETGFAALLAGGVLAPLNHRLSTAEIAAQLADSEPVLLVIGPEFLPQLEALRGACPAIAAVLLSGDGEVPTGLHSYDRALAAASPLTDAGRGGDDLACLFYTGGTTGAPKGVMLSHANILANSVNFIAHIGMDEETVHLHCGPLFHVAAAVRLFSVTQAAGTHVMLPRFAPPEVLETIERAGVTLATFVPTMLRTLLDDPSLAAHDLSSLRYITYGAAPMPEVLLREAMEKLPHVRFVQSYGMTETSPIATMLGWRDHLSDARAKGRLRSAGRPALLADIAIHDPTTGLPVSTGDTGEVVIRGPMVMRGYWRKPEATTEALRNGWMHSGDVGFLDADGYLHIVDRLKDVIISGGENIYSLEVENAIASHPAVQQCAVFGRPDPKWGEAVHAVVVPKTEQALTGDQVIAHCRTLIAGFKCPRSVDIRLEPLPLSGANKILKTDLRRALLAAEAAS